MHLLYRLAFVLTAARRTFKGHVHPPVSAPWRDRRPRGARRGFRSHARRRPRDLQGAHETAVTARDECKKRRGASAGRHEHRREGRRWRGWRRRRGRCSRSGRSTGADGAAGPGFGVLDTNGNAVGTLLTSNANSTNVLREIDGAFYVLQVTADGFFARTTRTASSAIRLPPARAPGTSAHSPLRPC